MSLHSPQELFPDGKSEYVETVSFQPVDMMLPKDMQLANEYTYSRHHIDKYIRHEIETNPDTVERLHEAIALWKVFVSQKYYKSKNKRLKPLRKLSDDAWYEMAVQMAMGCAYCQHPELFTSISGKLAYRLGWDDQRDAIYTMAELLVAFGHCDLIGIVRIDSGGAGARYKQTSIAVEACFTLSDELVKYVRKSSYLPPMVCQPQVIENNHQSGYLTHDDSVVLNYHTDEPIALDVINTQNQMALTLDLEFLLNVEHVPNKELDSPRKLEAWRIFRKDANDFYLLLHNQSQGNTETPGAMHFNHKYCTRGRLYDQGYHLHYQGQAYQKAVWEFAEPEYVEIPEEYLCFT